MRRLVQPSVFHRTRFVAPRAERGTAVSRLDFTETTDVFATLLTRPRQTTTALAALALTALMCHPTLARSVGVDVWNVPELNAQVEAATGENSRLSTEDEVVLKRIAMKEAVVRELLDGRATLDEATDRFAELNANRPASLDMVRAYYPGTTDREKIARNVIGFTLDRAPTQVYDAVAKRLDAELHQIIAASSAH